MLWKTGWSYLKYRLFGDNTDQRQENGDLVKENTETGKLVDGNTRVNELKKRAADPNNKEVTPKTKIKVQNHTPEKID